MVQCVSAELKGKLMETDVLGKMLSLVIGIGSGGGRQIRSD